uniref:Uncharacterized protein n=1 Tax=Arion vulgaris TaxID=1028688 RepID=A0A0B7C010_9EUPU
MSSGNMGLSDLDTSQDLRRFLYLDTYPYLRHSVVHGYLRKTFFTRVAKVSATPTDCQEEVRMMPTMMICFEK